MKPLTCLLLVCTVLTLGLRAQADPTTQPTTDRDVDIHRLTVHPSATTRPLMKYTFVTPVVDRTHGNAAILYLTASQIVPPNSAPGPTTRASEDLVDEYLNLPAEKLLKSDVAEFLTRTEAVTHLLDDAGARNECQWDMPPREGHSDDLKAELAQLNIMRYLSQLLSVRLRFEIAQHRYDAAVLTLRSGFALSKNVGSHALLINALVSAGCAGNMVYRMEELEQAPGAPNLYRALADLPRPFVDMRDVLQNEMAQVTFKQLGEQIARYQYQEAWDQLYTAFLLPYPQEFAALQRMKAEQTNVMSQILVPSMNRAARTMETIDSDIVLYECIEAIRAYAAGHDGKPPATLEDLVEMPAPMDPMTGKPFRYTVAGQTFTLDAAPWPDGERHLSRRMEVTVVPDARTPTDKQLDK